MFEIPIFFNKWWDDNATTTFVEVSVQKYYLFLLLVAYYGRLKSPVNITDDSIAVLTWKRASSVRLIAFKFGENPVASDSYF